ncbi:hypothetical protein DSECCO2_662590 [anaerobic digester metagenome]
MENSKGLFVPAICFIGVRFASKTIGGHSTKVIECKGIIFIRFCEEKFTSLVKVLRDSSILIAVQILLCLFVAIRPP